MTIHAHAAYTKATPLRAFTYTPQDLGPFDVEIDITHCGICHSDVHLIDDDWGISAFPLVPGHEIIGVVRALGPQADPALHGKRVGVGWQRASCQRCTYCTQGRNNLCADLVTTTANHYGGFAERIRVDSRFAFPIPDAIDSAAAAPLLCAGVTVYNPLRNNNIRASDRVGVIGIGGLGHLAIQFAAVLGCEVTAFTSNPAKAEQARELGASHVVSSRDADALRQIDRELDFIVSTVSARLDWDAYLQTLRPGGTLCMAGALADDISISPEVLMDRELRLTGSSIGGRVDMAEMLSVAAHHGVTAWTEVLPFDSVNEAVDRLRVNDVRYRFVLAR
ncbi:MAG: NAD(P)-dependent alcohol dehydrogenase [Chloroflexota bacterium]